MTHLLGLEKALYENLALMLDDAASCIGLVLKNPLAVNNIGILQWFYKLPGPDGSMLIHLVLQGGFPLWPVTACPGLLDSLQFISHGMHSCLHPWQTQMAMAALHYPPPQAPCLVVLLPALRTLLGMACPWDMWVTLGAQCSSLCPR
jgi:hypothetical protein